jgi:hypothetical protein
MSHDDQRNTLIVELTGRSRQSDFQQFDDDTLAGMGAVLVFLREAKIRDDRALKAMSADDQRNTLIVEVEAQTHLGVAKLQSLDNMALVLAALGVDPVFTAARPRSLVFSVGGVEVLTQKSDPDHSDSDWLTIVVTLMNPATRNARTLEPRIHHIEGAIKTGDDIVGPFETDPFDAAEGEIVVINYVLMNLGSSDAEEQFAQAVKVTDKVVGVVAPIAGAAIGFIVFGDPGLGLKMGQTIAEGLDKVISTLSDAVDFLGVHAGPPNCNGEVLHDTLTFLPGELAQALDQPASREYTGPQETSRCGSPPRSKVNFTLRRAPVGLTPPTP